jgi:hypothetical protein
MNAPGFDVIARHAAAVTRRASLLALGGAILAAAPAPSVAKAGGRCRKKVAKAAKRCDAKTAAMCEEFRLDCRQMVTAFCNLKFPSTPQALQCEAARQGCCDALTSCDVRTNLECLLGTFV